MADSSNTASDWHQLAINLLRLKLSSFCNFAVCSAVLYDKKWNFYTNFTPQGKAMKQNEYGEKIVYS